MPELRIILLVVGVVFIAAIAGYEWWRSRGQRPAPAAASRGVARHEERRSSRGEERGGAEERPEVPVPRAELKPLPEIHVVREPRVEVPDSLPVIELPSASESGTRRALGISISREVAVDVSGDSAPAHRIGRDDEVSEARLVPEPQFPDDAPPLSLTWPPESERRIVTLRVVPTGEPRFQGRLLRQAFAGCGFRHGPLEIFHLPDEQGRVLLSAAALAQPGTFDPSIMDSQRFSGVNLFAVLPAALPEREIFEELVHAARQLAERLDGRITDQHGEELTAARVTRLRQSLDQPAQARISGQA